MAHTTVCGTRLYPQLTAKGIASGGGPIALVFGCKVCLGVKASSGRALGGQRTLPGVILVLRHGSVWDGIACHSYRALKRCSALRAVEFYLNRA